MPLSQNYNISPYNDDWDATKQYYKILFRPSVPVQARELTQLQTILQNQIEEFGSNILEQGTIIRGCTFNFINKYPFVKIKDLQVDGQPVNIFAFANGYAKELSTNLTAKILNYTSGLESQAPNLNTLYVKYTNAGSGGETTFANNSILSIYSENYSLQDIEIVDGGTGYNNADILIFTSGTGSGAAGFVRTDSSGVITTATLSATGNSYFTAPTITVANSSSGTANGTGASLTAINYIGQVTVAANTIASGANTDTYPTGYGYGFKVSDGVVFQKGYFLYVDPQEVIVSAYNQYPSNTTVGFTVTESVVNNSIDTSLNDNAQGILNEGAPGAYRLKLEPTLQVVDAANSASSNNYFTLVEFQNGVAVRQKQTTQYNQIGKELAKRTKEESGDYVVKPFNIISQEIFGNTTHFNTFVSAGIAYVDGFRVELFGKVPLVMRKGTDILEKNNQIISANYGSYVLVDEYVGSYLFNTGASVSLRDTAAARITSGNFSVGSAPGSEIGTAKIRSMVLHSGTQGHPDCVYRLYLFDISMNSGKNFDSVRSIFFDDTVDAISDVVLNTFGNAELVDYQRQPLIFPFANKAIKTLRDLSANNDTVFTYRTINTGASFDTSGNCTITVSGIEKFPYSPGNISSVEEDDFVIMTTSAANSTATFTGTANVTSGQANVLGNSSAFLTDYSAGDYIAINGEFKRIIQVTNNSHMIVDGNYSGSATANTHKRYYPAYRAIPFSAKAIRVANVASGQQSVAFSLGEGLSGSVSAHIQYNVNRNPAVQRTKELQYQVLVKIATATHTATNVGPWSLGVPDVYEIVSVTKTTNADYTTSATDVTSHFLLDTGQKDGFYGISKIYKKPGSSLSIGATDYILVTFNAFKHTNTGGGTGFFSVDSYPVDDSSSVLPNTSIRTQNIPVYVSPTSGVSYDLRNCVDFRPSAANVVVYTSTLGSANVNPTSTVSLGTSEKYFPKPDSVFEADVQYYIGRIDKIAINNLGQVVSVEGSPSENPYPPQDQGGAMTLATVVIPPYPSLSPEQAVASGRLDYSVRTTSTQTKRLTMKQLVGLENRISKLEYYTSYNLLESATKDLVIPSEVDSTINRFKNGIYVDSFKDFSLSNPSDPEYSASIDIANEELVPAFTQRYIELEVASLSDLDQSGDLVMLEYDEVTLAEQPYATRTRVCVEDYWEFNGRLNLIPNYDGYFEVRTNPVVVTVGGGSGITQNTQTTNVNTIFNLNMPIDLSYLNLNIVNINGLGPG